MDDKLHRITRADLLLLSRESFQDRLNALKSTDGTKTTVLDYLEMFEIVSIIQEKRIDIPNSEQVIDDFENKFKGEFYNGDFGLSEITKYFDEVYGSSSSHNFNFQDSLLMIFERFNFSNHINEIEFERIFSRYNIPLYKLLRSEWWFKQYPDFLRRELLSRTSNFELLLKNFADSKNRYVIPNNITKSDWYDLASRYISDKKGVADKEFESNLNYLRLLRNKLKGIGKYIEIDPELKLLLENQIQRKESEYFKHATTQTQNIPIYYHPNGQDKDLFSKNSTYFGIVDIDFLKQHSDFPTLLNYLKYLRHFLTPTGILNLSSFPNIEESAFVGAFGVRSKHEYRTSYVFDIKNELVLQELRIFNSVIEEEHGITFKKIFEHFFTEYSKNELNMTWLRIPFSSDELYSVRTKILFSSEENLRRQWKMYINKKEIDPKLFEFEKAPKFKDLGSLLPHKYIYPASDITKRIINLLYSDQTTIGYLSKSKNESNFVRLVNLHRVNISEFNSNQRNYVDFLMQENVISLNEEGIITFDESQKLMLYLYSQLWSYGVIHYYNLPTVLNGKTKGVYQSLIDTKIKSNIFRSGSSLFSEPEADFLNYLLNDQDFENSKSLRNKHIHGDSSDNDDEYIEDFLYAVIVFLLYIVKINEEFHFDALLNGEEGFWSEF